MWRDWKGMHLYVRWVTHTGVQTFQVDVPTEGRSDELREVVSTRLKLGAQLALFAVIHEVKVTHTQVLIVDGWPLSKFLLTEESVVLAETRRKTREERHTLVTGLAKHMLASSRRGDLEQLQTLYFHYEHHGHCTLDVSSSLLDCPAGLGWTCMHFACQAGHRAVVEWLVEKGANVNAETVDGWTPLALAAANNHTQCKRQAGIHALNGSRRLLVNYFSEVRGSALHIASSRSMEEAVQVLVSLGASVTQPDPHGRCLTDLAPAVLTPTRWQRSASTSAEALSDPAEELEVPPPFTGMLHYSGNRSDHSVFVMLRPEEGKLQRFDSKDDFYDQREPDAEVCIADILDARLATVASKTYLIIMHRAGRDRYFSEFPEVTAEWLTQIQYSIKLQRERSTPFSRNASVGYRMRRCQSKESLAESNSPTDTSMEKEAEVALDDFEALDTLGAGAFGSVFKVRKKDSGQIFALKVLNKRKLVENKQLKHVVNEAKIHLALDSPFIVKLHYKFQTPRKLYFVMDCCQNGDLGTLISERGSLPEETVRFYMAEILTALEYLHERGIVYRDMKPENIMLDADGHIRLTDFGLAKEALTDSTLHKTFCGTIAYLSPEMLLRKGVNKPADVYGAGTVMYELLTGDSPHYSEDMPTMLRKIKQGKISFPWKTSAAARSLLSAALAVEPGDRPTIKEMKTHEFFRGVDWQRVERREATPPKLKSRPGSPTTAVTLNDHGYSKTVSMEECLLHF